MTVMWKRLTGTNPDFNSNLRYFNTWKLASITVLTVLLMIIVAINFAEIVQASNCGVGMNYGSVT